MKLLGLVGSPLYFKVPSRLTAFKGAVAEDQDLGPLENAKIMGEMLVREIGG
jgi:hypothetical protein